MFPSHREVGTCCFTFVRSVRPLSLCLCVPSSALVHASCLLSLSVCAACGESVSDSFLSSAFYGTGGQTRDIDPMLD